MNSASGLVTGSACLALCLALAPGSQAIPPDDAGKEVHMANGIKIGEATPSSAIIWTRLTRNPDRNINGAPFATFPRPATQAEQLQGRGLDVMEGSVPGAEGQVRVTYWPDGSDPDAAGARRTPWEPVDPSADFTRQFPLENLLPGTLHHCRVEGRAPGADAPGCSLVGRFRTAPAPDQTARVLFTVVTGQQHANRDDEQMGHRIYPAMQALDPSFFVHTGDIEYYDKADLWATSPALARFKWNRIYALPFQRAFHNEVASYFIKDDHDTLKDDCWPGQSFGDLTWEQGLAIFREQVPISGSTYRTIRWGRDLQIWLVEGRDFRSPNNAPDGPEKSIWGPEQKQWFFDTVKASDATFRLLISPTPLVGPDRSSKKDNHANRAFAHEGRELRSFIASQKNMAVICGDRHWQYVSVDPQTAVREYSCGPTSDKHAGGFSDSLKTDAHRFLRISGGFLSVTIERIQGKPRAVFRHHDVSGQVVHEDILQAP